MRAPRPSRPARASRGSALAAILLLALAAASCARAPRGPASSAEQLSVRHATERVKREQALSALRADVVLRLDGRATGRLPAFSASIAIASPSRVRVQARALLGVALDLGVRGDSLFVRIPSERAAFVLDRAAESLGIGPPAAFLGRAMGATWKPPAEAWRSATADSAGWHVGWRDGGDSLAITVDGRGLPRQARLSREEHVVRIEYREWADVRGRQWPVAVEIADEAGWVRARLAVEDLVISKKAESAWFEWRMSAGTRVLGWEDVREVFRRLGGT